MVPRVVAGSNGAPAAASRSRSMVKSSAAAGTGPSSLKRTLAGGSCGAVSGTSNVPADMTSFLPDGTSAIALFSVITALRPTMCTLRSASCSAGRPCTGCTTQLVACASIDRPSSGTGGPEALSVFERRVHRDDHALDGAAVEMRQEPVAHFRRDENRPQPLQGIDRHARCGKSRRQTQVAAGNIPPCRTWRRRSRRCRCRRLRARSACLAGSNWPPKATRLSTSGVAGKVGRIEHDRAAADLEQPEAAGLRAARGLRSSA